MASSMLTGERRWASARKTGMTVLGKVPKPMNLPSQRLENHGLDPSVEIVPKGTLTWGSKPSSAATNAWGTSSVSSPHAEGSIGSPSFASGRPSSGGSGTRPSTAGSDRSYEPVSNAWGPSSRPSSASGILASSQMSAAGTRPRSADTRPGSSQLSRFAENSVDNTVAWGSTGTAERLGAISSKARGFTLSSGDFPTLGSEKNSDSHSQRGHSSQGRPASASGTSSTLKETLEPHLIENRNVDHSDHGNVNTWKAENHPYVGDGAPPYMENWQKDPQQAQSYTNVNIPPRNFDSWRNPPFHPVDAAWYRGGGPVGPYRPSGPPGSYFDPHVSARPLPNSQAVPRPDASSVGYRPNNGEPYRPHMPPEPYMGPGHSNMPLRPGPYPGPVPYEGYYGPQAGFYNSSEKGPIMPMVRPVVYNQYPSQNPHLDPGNYHARPGGYATAMNEEQIKLGQTHENQGQFRVLLKQHDVREGREVHGKPEQSLMGTAPHLEREIQPGLLRQEGDRRTKIQKAEPAKTLSLPPVEGAPSMHKSSSRDVDSSDCHHRNFSENSIKEADDRLIRREETTNARVRDRKQYPVMKKNSPLMEKGVGLHTKAQITDRQNDFGMCSSKEKTKSKDVTITADQSTSMVNVPTSNDVILVPGKPNAFTEEKYHESTTVDKVLHVPSLPLGTSENVHFEGQTRVHDVKGIDHQGESRSSRHDNDERMKKVPGSESSITTCLSSKGILLASPPDSAASVVAPEKHGVPHAASSGDGSYSASSLDTIDHKAQRAKVKEMATQRAKQLQKEEEERTREQKAKALAKLEELNRRTSAESSNQKVNNSPPSSNDLLDKKQDSGAGMVLKADMVFPLAPLGTCSEAVTPTDDDGTRSAENLINATSDVAAQHSDSAVQTSNLSPNQHLEPSQDTVSKKVMHETAPDIHGTSSKNEQFGYGRRQTITSNRSMGEKQASTMSTGNPEYTCEVAMNTSTSDVLANIEENSVRHRKKNNKSARNNKNKPDEGLPNASFPSPDSELVPQKLHPGSRKSNASVSAAEAISVSSESLHATVVPAEALSVENSSEIPDMPLKQGLTESTEESQARVNDHWKPHPHRKSAKTQQTNKSVSKYNVGVEAVIWAPVKPLNKNGPSVEVSKNSVIEATYPSGKSGHDMQSGIKAMRAEMERYIWKPVAKELSQQVNSQQNSPSQSHPEAGDMSAKHDSNRLTVEFGKPDGVTVGKATIATDARSGENIKHNNHGKISSSWRQRSSETPRVVGSLSSDPPKADQKASDQLQPSTTDSVLKRDMTHIHDGWNDVTITSPPGGSVAAVPKNVGANRQRRQPYKAQRVPGSSYPTDNTDTHRVVTDRRETHSPALVLNNSDGGKVMKTESENTAIDEHSKPHWQPKSQAYSHHGRQGNRGTGGRQRVSAQGTDCNVVQNEHKNDISPRTVGAEAGDVRLQDAKRGGKGVGDTSKDDSTVGSAPVDVNPQHQQSVALEVDHQGHYNNRLKRGHDSRYRGKDMGQDAGKRNFHMNGDERKNSPHLEYQQVGNYHKPQNFEKLFLQVMEVNIDNTFALWWVVSQIFDKAVTEPTFCEMYANLCAHLSYELPEFNEDNKKVTFRRLLLNMCQEEFERGEREEAEANRAEEEGEIKQTEAEREEKRTRARRRMLGNIRFIGELYKKRMLTERIMHECIKKLLGEYENPDEEDLEALCVLMSTIGEMIDHPRAKVHMEAYFDRMLKLSTDQKLSSQVRFMLRDAIDLRKNKWQQRRKIEGPKKIDEVHRDAAQKRQAQASRFSRGPVISSAPRHGPPADYSSRSNSVLPFLSSQQINSIRGLPAQVRGHATQDVRMVESHQFESRVLSVPLPQRSTDDSITLGPQGGLARGMSIRGQPLMSNAPSADVPPNLRDPRRLASGSNSYNFMSREDSMPRYTQDKFSSAQYNQPSPYGRSSSIGSRDPQFPDYVTDKSAVTTFTGRINASSGILPAPSETKQLSQESLREKSISAIREFYSAKDEEEVILCIKELKSPSFYPSMVSLWVTDSFERKDKERDLLAKLLVNLCKSRDNLLRQNQLIQGFVSVLSTLEDAVNDAPRAAEFLGHIFAKVTLEHVVPLTEIARLIREGGEEPGSLVETGLASEVLASILQFIRTEKGDSVLSEIRTSSGLRLEDFRPPHSTRSKKLDPFL